MAFFGFDPSEVAYVARAYFNLVTEARSFNTNTSAVPEERISLANHMIGKINDYNRVIPKKVQELLRDPDISGAEAKCKEILDSCKIKNCE
jgi:hypothetical protein